MTTSPEPRQALSSNTGPRLPRDRRAARRARHPGPVDLVAVLSAAASLLVLLACADAVLAAPARCVDTIARAADAYLQGRSRNLARCADRALQAGDVAAAAACASEPATAARLAALEAKLAGRIAASCGGADRTCGNGDDEPLSALGWDVASCADLGAAGCVLPITDCGAIAQCVACTVASATGIVAGSSAHDLAATADPVLRGCQRALAAASDAYLRAASRALTSCQRRVAAGTLVGPCPATPDDRFAAKLATLARQSARKICRACGGGDRGCDAATGGLPGTAGADDPAAGAITTVAECRDVVVPSTDARCAAPLDGASDVVACAGCVTRHAAECVTAQLTPAAGAAPAGCGGTAAPECPGCLLWSDPATWGGAVPGPGDDVDIAADRAILLDQDSAALGGLTIDGTLRFARADLALTADWIMVHGTLAIGSAAQPFTQQAVITLTGAPGESVMGMGTRGIMVMGGTLDLHGTPPPVAWTKLGAHAAAGTSVLQLVESPGWSAGDQIVVAPTDYYGASATEALTIAAIDGDQLTTTTPLAAFRWGVLQHATAGGMALAPDGSIVPPLPETPLVLDERAEVASLTRNLVIAGADDAHWQTGGFGAHVMIMGDGGTARVDGVEIRRGGQRGALARYPFHWHMLSYAGASFLGDTTGQYLRRSTINRSANRGIVIHGTNGVEVSENVVHDVRGHAVFTEDAVERRNTIHGNLTLHVRNPLPGQQLKLHEIFENGGSSGFWIANPDNTVTGNTAADSQGFGFWLAFPNEPFGPSSAVPMRPSRMRFGTFDGNSAHSSGFEGLMFDNVEVSNDGSVAPFQYLSTTDGNDPTWNSGTLRRFAIARFTTWKNRRGGIWDRVAWPDIVEVVSADNCGRFFAGSGADGVIAASLIVGTSLNVTPRPAFGFDDTLGGDETPTAFATYHSAFDMRDNVIVAFPLVPGQRSGAFATEDYYIRPVDKGQMRNTGNLLIGSHPGFRSQPVLDTYVLSGALWDPIGHWGPAGDWFVYDDPFFTYGQLVTPGVPAGQTGGVSVPGPFYGLLEFVVDNANEYYFPLMAIHAVRLDPATLAEVGSWSVEEALPASLLAPMRHFAAHRDGVYRLEFPGRPLPHDLEVRFENMLETSDTLLIAVQFDGAVAPANVYTVGSGAVAGYAQVGSFAEVRDSSGGTWWQDAAADVVWVKLRGGSWQWWDQTFTIAVPSSDQLLYESTVLHVNTD
jgi:hypothetical protein